MACIRKDGKDGDVGVVFTRYQFDLRERSLLEQPLHPTRKTNELVHQEELPNSCGVLYEQLAWATWPKATGEDSAGIYCRMSTVYTVLGDVVHRVGEADMASR